MANSSQQEVANALYRVARLLEVAQAQAQQLADRAAAGDVTGAEEGLGFHYLVDQALRSVTGVLSNAPFGEAFQAAADADRPA